MVVIQRDKAMDKTKNTNIMRAAQITNNGDVTPVTDTHTHFHTHAHVKVEQYSVEAKRNNGNFNRRLEHGISAETILMQMGTYLSSVNEMEQANL